MNPSLPQSPSPLKERLAKLPQDPGVYLMKDAHGCIIYVGKAKNLNKRVHSYFSPTDKTYKTTVLSQAICDIEVIITQTEVEALLLENHLIKQHQPKFNVMLKDDKTYPYIKVTMAEAFPRVIKTRLRISDGSRYFGPFPSESGVYKTIDLLEKAFMYRKCRNPMPKKLCLTYHLRQCVGPCEIADAATEHRNIIDQVIQVLEGKDEQVSEQLKARMHEAAEKKLFEKAALIRDQIKALERIHEKQHVVHPDRNAKDVFAFAVMGQKAYVVVHQYREGVLLGQLGYLAKHAGAPEDVLHHAIIDHYLDRADAPSEILAEVEPAQPELLVSWLAQKLGHAVSMDSPQRGFKKQLVLMAKKNALQKIKPGANSPLRETPLLLILQQLQDEFTLRQVPRHIECVDISNTGFKVITGATVAFCEGRPEKRFYRHYTVKTLDQQTDDYAAMAEVVTRRLNQADLPRPQLLLIDGGEGHVARVTSVLRRLHVDDIELLGLAKREEEIVLPLQGRRIKLNPKHPSHRLLIALRDEAHRFSNRLRKQQHQHISLHSVLNEIQGLGPKRQRLLLDGFGSVEGIAKANVDQLKSVARLPDTVASDIRRQLRSAAKGKF